MAVTFTDEQIREAAENMRGNGWTDVEVDAFLRSGLGKDIRPPKRLAFTVEFELDPGYFGDWTNCHALAKMIAAGFAEMNNTKEYSFSDQAEPNRILVTAAERTATRGVMEKTARSTYREVF